MTPPNTDNVTAAFELLIEELAKAADAINADGANAFREGKHGEVETLLGRVKTIEATIKKVSALEEGWLQDFRVAADPSAPDRNGDDLPTLVMSYKNARATAAYDNKSVVIFAGSTIRRPTFDSLSDTLQDLRHQCEADGSLTKADDPDLLRLTKNMTFRSPSGAAQFVAGCSVSGNRDWVLKTSQEPLGSYLRRLHHRSEDK